MRNRTLFIAATAALALGGLTSITSAAGGPSDNPGPTDPPCPADVNQDGAVDVDDLIMVIVAWGVNEGPEDIDDSGLVALPDLMSVIDAWGPCL